jgi:hypothetical protein
MELDRVAVGVVDEDLPSPGAASSRRFKADASARVELVFGCKTRVIE